MASNLAKGVFLALATDKRFFYGIPTQKIILEVYGRMYPLRVTRFFCGTFGVTNNQMHEMQQINMKHTDFLGEKLHEMKMDLLGFWTKFGGKANYGKGFTEKEKLDALIELANKIYFTRTKSLRRYRKKFNKNYKGTFIFPCFVCLKRGNHRHHIISLHNGGNNGKSNRLMLCLKHHKDIHPWIEARPLPGYGSSGDRPTDRPTEMRLN